MSSPITIGFIGLGIMGEGMAARLLSEKIAGTCAEHPLILWNRTGSKCEDFEKSANANANANKEDYHIKVAESPKEVVEQASIVFSMLSTPEASRAVFEGDDGVLAGVSKSSSIVDCATLAESDMKRMNDAILAKGGRFLEAPVSGSKAPAANGSLIFLCAGSNSLFTEIVGTALKAMGKASHYFGNEEKVGHGTRAKLVVNALMGTMVAAYGEGLALSESVGLDPSKIIEIIGQGAIQSPVYGLKGPKMIVKDHAPNFPLKHAHKDMALACEMAKDAGVEFTVMDQAEKLLRSAREDENLNLADLDFSAVFEKIHSESTSEFSKKR